jgi:hypothetical protein
MARLVDGCGGWFDLDLHETERQLLLQVLKDVKEPSPQVLKMIKDLERIIPMI